MSIINLSNNPQVTNQCEINPLTLANVSTDNPLDDLINNSLSQELDLITCVSTTSNYAICTDVTPVSSILELQANTPAYSQSETDITQLKKRKRLNSPNGNENKDNTIRAELRVLRKAKKSVSFVIQEDDKPSARNSAHQTSASASTSRASTEAVEMDDADSSEDDDIPDTGEQALLDAREYTVPGEHVNLWRLLLNAMKNTARAHARKHHLEECIEGNTLPLWCYGMSLAPSWLQPFKPAQQREAHASAMRMAETTRDELQVEIASSTRESNELREALQRMYRHSSNPDSNLAIQRAAGIATHFRAKETAQQVRQRAEDDKTRPNSDSDWNTALSRRQVPRPASPKKGQQPKPKKSVKPTTTTSNVVEDGERPSTSHASSTKSVHKPKKGKKRPRSPAPSASNSAMSNGSKHSTKTPKKKSPPKQPKQDDDKLTDEEAAMLKILRAALSKKKK